MLQSAYAWCLANKVELVAILGSISHIATILNQLIPDGKGPAWLHGALGRIGALNKDGEFSMPLWSGNAKPAPLPIPPAVLIAFFAGCLSLGACSTIKAIGTQCALPGVEKIVAQIIPSIVAALVSDSYDQLIGQIVDTLKQQGVSDALGVVTCAIQNLSGNLRADVKSPNAIALRLHAQAWLLNHKAQ